MNPVIIFIMAYSLGSFGYLLYRYSFSVIYSAANLKTARLRRIPKVSIIIPNYNEEPEALEKCIRSCCENSYPNKEIIVIDDGSSETSCQTLIKKLSKELNFKTIFFEKNKGKREAMTAGFKVSNGEIIITTDSDSIIVDGESLFELIRPFSDLSIGAVSGNVQVLNKNTNWLTRIQWARYWLAFNVEKASQSPYSGVTCCSGPFSAYRKTYLMKFLDEWSNQYFLGKRCTYGDDRGLTTLMLRQGYKVKFAKYALCLTNVPEKFTKFTKQQIRWKKSFIRENLYISKFILNKNIFMQIEYFWFWMTFCLGFIIKGIAFALIFTGSLPLISFGIMIVFVSLLHYLFAFIRNPGEIGLLGIVYGFINEFWITWFFWYALFTLKETKWGTR